MRSNVVVGARKLTGAHRPHRDERDGPYPFHYSRKTIGSVFSFYLRKVFAWLHRMVLYTLYRN